MAKKQCGICGKQLGFWSSRYTVKDGTICGECIHTADFFNGVSQARINKFIDTQTIAEIKDLIDNPEKLEEVKQKVAPAKHYHLSPIAKCSFCGKDIYHGDAPLKFKNSEYLCRTCMAKCKFTMSSVRAHTWASSHTIGDLKKYLDQGKDFSDIYSEIDKQLQQEEAEEEQRKQKIEAFKKKSVKYSHYYFCVDERELLIGKTFLDDPRFVDASEIVSYSVNEKGHDENKRHTITRSAVGAVLAGPVGAIIGGTTGGKMYEYVDHLGLIFTLSDSSNYEIKFLTSKTKSTSLLGKSAYSQLQAVISILDSWAAQKDTSTQNNSQTDVSTEIRKFKQLADDGVITQEEFEAKKKQLLGF